MRINKYLAQNNYSTRRGADELIASGKVFVNGVRAKIGMDIAETDKVEVRGVAAREYAYIAFHKPKGVNTLKEPFGGKCILDILPKSLRNKNIFPVGRLDKNSDGLIILTDDGRVTDRLLNPKYEHEKAYEVRVKNPLRSSFKDKMESGVNIDGYVTKPCRIKIHDETDFRITLMEGKTHQIRRMCAALFNEVVSLKRVSIMNVKLGNLKPGEYKNITGDELNNFLSGLRLNTAYSSLA